MRLISLLILVSLVSGCGSFFGPKEKLVVKTDNVFIPIVCPPQSKPLPIKPKPIEPIAVQDQAGIWWVGFDPDHYGNIAINTEETIRFIKDQNGVIEYYVDCVADFNKLVDEKNGVQATPTESEVSEEATEEVIE